MSEKLDLFHVLSQFNKHNVDFFDKLTDEDNKQLHPFVIQRWLSGTSNEMQVQLINQYSNSTVFNSAHSHRKLAWYVLLASSLPQHQRYSWIKTVPKDKKLNKPLSIRVLQETYTYSRKQAEQSLGVLSGQDIIEMAEALGWQDTEIHGIVKEHKLPKVK